ncbi:hypothetical protein TcCL_Unassigned01957, partial [Trypanosoma cruzi]
PREGFGHAAVPRVVSPRNVTADMFSSGRARGGGGIHCLAACWWRRLQSCSVSERGCPAGAVLGWVGKALRGETPSATLDRRVHALPSRSSPSIRQPHSHRRTVPEATH